jgi:ribose transport system substrate-binding protein
MALPHFQRQPNVFPKFGGFRRFLSIVPLANCVSCTTVRRFRSASDRRFVNKSEHGRLVTRFSRAHLSFIVPSQNRFACYCEFQKAKISLEGVKRMKKLRFLLSLVTQNNDYQLEQAAAARAAAQDVGADLEIVYADGDTITQSTQILRAIQADPLLRPVAVIFEPVGGTALPQVARTAVAAGIGWAVLNSDPSYIGELRTSAKAPLFSVSSDHKEIGRIQGRQYAALLPRGGTLIYVQGPSDNLAAKDRAAGMQSTLPGNIQAVLLKGQWTEESAVKCVNSWLKLAATGKTRVDLVGAQNDAMAIGARKVFATVSSPEERNRWMRIPYTGVDGLPKTGQAWVRDGSLTATIVVPANAGKALRLMNDAMQTGRSVTERTYTVAESMPTIEKLSSLKLAS